MIFSTFVSEHPEVFPLFKRVLVFGCLAIAALPIQAANVITRSAASSTSIWDTGNTGPVVLTSWTQAAGTQFSTVTIALAVCSETGSNVTGTVFVTNSIGGGTTGANQVATASVSTSTFCAPATAASPQTVLTGVTLPAASATTYYLVMSIPAGMGVQASNVAVESVASGVTSNVDQFATTAAGYPPASTFAPFSSPSRGILFSVTGAVGIPLPPATVPAVGTFGLIAAASLLAFAGVLFLRREPVNPLR
jgi:hypothetical protein